MCTNVFLSMPGTILIFFLPYFLSFLTSFSISNFLLSMLNSWLHYSQAGRPKIFKVPVSALLLIPLI